MNIGIRKDINYLPLSVAAAFLGLAFYFVGFTPLTLLCFIGAGMLYFLYQTKQQEKLQEKRTEG